MEVKGDRETDTLREVSLEIIGKIEGGGKSGAYGPGKMGRQLGYSSIDGGARGRAVKGEVDGTSPVLVGFGGVEETCSSVPFY